MLAEDGNVLGGPRGDQGELLRCAELVREMPELPELGRGPGQEHHPGCVCTDAALDKRSCGIVARVAGAGIARAVDPAFTPGDGDVTFCLASGTGGQPGTRPGQLVALIVLGTVAATVTAAAIRDAIRQAAPAAAG